MQSATAICSSGYVSLSQTYEIKISIRIISQGEEVNRGIGIGALSEFKLTFQFCPQVVFVWYVLLSMGNFCINTSVCQEEEPFVILRETGGCDFADLTMFLWFCVCFLGFGEGGHM